ncbi:MAG: DUF1353 domain-containing protein [Nocardioides sp.]
MEASIPQLTPANEDNFSYGEPLTATERQALWAAVPHDVMLWRRRRSDHGELFSLLASVTYRDEANARAITVPSNFGSFATDLTSVPSWFTWLVPKSGTHLPAALIHDGLVADPSGPPSYTTEPPGPRIDRIDADVVFRNAMRDTHVGVVRRWLVWSAVSTLSLWKRGRYDWSTAMIWRYRAAILITFVTIGYLGACATLDLADWHWPGFWDLPWMREGNMVTETAGGLAGAFAVPVFLTPLWGRYWRIAIIGSLAIATLFHATVVVGAVALAYQGLERFANRWPQVALTLLLGLIVAGVAYFLVLLAP